MKVKLYAQTRNGIGCGFSGSRDHRQNSRCTQEPRGVGLLIVKLYNTMQKTTRTHVCKGTAHSTSPTSKLAAMSQTNRPNMAGYAKQTTKLKSKIQTRKCISNTSSSCCRTTLALAWTTGTPCSMRCSRVTCVTWLEALPKPATCAAPRGREPVEATGSRAEFVVAADAAVGANSSSSSSSSTQTLGLPTGVAGTVEIAMFDQSPTQAPPDMHQAGTGPPSWEGAHHKRGPSECPELARR
mmetsp:Transcript_95378/g.273508  ORF Transcript_95378/g.273508 Transcript_95378/m.273508 type:complete len:240 (+) Transcript_95378:609-1328(+)